MKILFLANGNSIHTQRWVKWYLDSGWDVELVTIKRLPNENEFKKISQYILPNIPIGYTSKYWKIMLPIKIMIYVPILLRITRKVRPDIIIAHEIPTWGVYLGYMKKFNNYSSTMCVSWGFSKMDENEYIRTHAETTALKQIDYIRAQSQSITDALITYRKVPANKILFKTWGIDTKLFKKLSEEEKRALKIKMGLEGKKIVISTRNIAPFYNIDTILRAMKLVHEHDSEIRCIILKGSSDESYRKEMISLSNELEINSICTFLDSQSSLDDVAQYLSISDVSVMVPNTDQASASLLEAMACGVVPICTNIPANMEWIEHRKNGFLIEPRDHENLARYIIEVLAKGTISENVLNNNRVLVEERANWYKNMAEIEHQSKLIAKKEYIN